MKYCVQLTRCELIVLNIVFVSVLATSKNYFGVQGLKPPASEFVRHNVVRPVVYHARTKRQISTTQDGERSHHKEVTVHLNVATEPHTLDLWLNEDLITQGHVLSYQRNGTTVLHRPSKNELNVCQYKGTIRDRPNSMVAVSTCHGIRGIIYDGLSMKYIEPAQDNEIESPHYVYEHKDLKSESKCGYNDGTTDKVEYDSELLQRERARREAQRSRAARYKRSSDEETLVRGPYNANKLSRYVELVLVADHREYQVNGESVEAVHHQMKDVANIINSVYAPLNIFIALVGVVVWSEQDEIQLEEDGDRTLTHFLHYRKMRLLNDIPNDNAQLLTRQKFQDGVVGKALKGPICTFEFSGGVSTNHSDVLGLVATTIAHELGHNFGMEHDAADECTCPDEKCIMSPSSTSVTPVHWSSCSLRSLALAFERGMDYCLRNKPVRLFESPTCGNGFVEPGEQCDCGAPRDSPAWAACAACCDAERCALRPNATCATGECCDLQSCRVRGAGAECRGAARECDLPEYCTGRSEHCPRDAHRADGTPCAKHAEAYCAHGSCRSRSDQCRLVWGSTGESSHEKCYLNNLKGNKNGNCGYDRARQAFAACAAEDASCGLLHCRHLNERLEFGMESVATLSAIFINNNGTIIPCRTAIIDLGLSDVDPGLVPDGAKCGENKMCMKQRCVPIEEIHRLLAAKPGSVCPSNCSGHGVCNSEGHCHCDVGFAPPLCDSPGPGGSYDSGPASDPSVQRRFVMVLYFTFLVIVPLVFLAIYLKRYNGIDLLSWWKKPKKPNQSPNKTSLQSRFTRGASKFAANFQNSSNHPQTVSVHTVSNHDDINSSLLRSDNNSPPASGNPNSIFFGNFKGFTLTPLNIETPVPSAVNKPNVGDEANNRSAKITPVHRSGSSGSNLHTQNAKPVHRSAPPLPVVPSFSSSPKMNSVTTGVVHNRIKALMSSDQDNAPVSTASSISRPVISSPILEASTCTAKELISPLQGSKTLGPSRAVPATSKTSSDLPKRPLSMHSSNAPMKPLPVEPKKEGISLNRIASFLKQDKTKDKERQPVERSNSLPKNPNHLVRSSKTLDKAALRKIQISSPILQKEIELPVHTVSVVSDSEDTDNGNSFVNRAQSMRIPITQRPILQSFGSMRKAPSVPRPVSVIGRPTAPPPPLPEQPKSDSIAISLYQHPKPLSEVKSLDYVDCIEEKQAPLAHIDEEATDNIYAVIEESPAKPMGALPGSTADLDKNNEQYKIPQPVTSSSGSTESMGLLGEIVNEIQNRNIESIYSTASLSRKKKAAELSDQNSPRNRDSSFTNTEHYKTPESIYSGEVKSSAASTTSSGYLIPSAINVPNYLNKQNTTNDESLNKNVIDKTPPSPTPKANSKIPTFTRQVTPPGLRNLSSFRTAPQSPKSLLKNNALKSASNSPDLVSSCSAADVKNGKAPDVINNNTVVSDTSRNSSKPITTPKPVDHRSVLKPVGDRKPNKSFPIVKPNNAPSTNLSKSQTEKTSPINRSNPKVDSNIKTIADSLNKNKPKVVPKPTMVSGNKSDTSVKTNTSKAVGKPSNVASLQQKFENRKSFIKDANVTKK